MCGIAGIVKRDPEAPVDPAVIGRMCDAIVHRGPDDSDVWFGRGVGLGHRRLSIIDLSPAGRQPMCNEDGSVWVVFNGEIYNFAELREELVAKGHTFRSRSDTETIVHMYEEEGERCIERLHGMFAIAIWDERRRKLVLARDRVGKKPLKYAEIDGGIVFASELKAILATGLVSAEVEPADIDAYFTFLYVPSPGTGLRGIKKLPPGHRLVWEDGRTRIERYWTLDYRAKRELPLAEWLAALRATVREAVVRRMISDVPLGAFLSGGVDSSIVVACMAEASSRPIETFSIGFEHEDYNELPYARQVAERYGTSHHEFMVRAEDVSLLPQLARLYEEPYADSSALPSYFLARETRQFVTVALSGDGGDEGFVGYDRYERIHRMRSRLAVAQLPGVRPLLGAAAALSRFLPPGLARDVEGLYGVTDPDLGASYTWMIRVFSDPEKRWLYAEPMRRFLAESQSRRISAWMDKPEAGREVLDRVCFAEVMTYLPEDVLVKMDLACMAHGLEARAPLLDHHVLELAASAPAELRFRGGTLKWLLKEAFREKLPAGFLDRPKRGFGIPIQHWFRGPLVPLTREVLLAPDARVARYMRPEALREAVEQHVAGKISRGYQLWSLLMLEFWHREVVEAKAPAALPAPR
jgi:asparagine synthase (glutamine-hydrolysing)